MDAKNLIFVNKRIDHCFFLYTAVFKIILSYFNTSNEKYSIFNIKKNTISTRQHYVIKYIKIVSPKIA